MDTDGNTINFESAYLLQIYDNQDFGLIAYKVTFHKLGIVDLLM